MMANGQQRVRPAVVQTYTILKMDMEPVNGDFLETIVLEWRAEQPNSFENVLAYTLEWQGSGKTKITLRGNAEIDHA